MRPYGIKRFAVKTNNKAARQQGKKQADDRESISEILNPCANGTCDYCYGPEGFDEKKEGTIIC